MDERKGCRVARLKLRHGFERNCDQIDENENKQETIDGRADTVANRPCSST